ncbi:MAG: ATP-binding cassette domain-containing protein [Zavarzinella sp.]
MTAHPPLVSIEGLCKTFPGPDGMPFAAVDDLSFDAFAGEVVGLLGANGAGKTTTLRILCTLLKPTAGFATVAGYDILQNPDDVRRQIGFLSANTGIYERLTAREMVEYYGKLHGLTGNELRERVDSLFDAFQMADIAQKKGGTLSTGQKQKVSIARALVHEPPVLIFDEPTIGLDVLVQRIVLDQVLALREQGKCILYSTHNFREVEKLCTRVIIIHQGKILASGTLAELKATYGKTDIEEIFFHLVEPNSRIS